MKEKFIKFCEKVGIKTLKTMAQTMVGLIGANQFIAQIDWKATLSATLLSGLVCVLMNIADIKE